MTSTERMRHRVAAPSTEPADAEREQQRQLTAERKQRWRARQRAGRFVVAVELSGDLLDRLTGGGWLTDAQTFDRAILAAEIPALLELLSRNRKL